MNKVKKHSRRMTAIVMMMAIIATSVKFETWALSSPVLYNGSGYDSIEEALEEARAEAKKDIYLTITEDMAITEAVLIKEKETVHIEAAEETEFLVDSGNNWNDNAVNGAVVFCVEKEGELTLNNIFIKGSENVNIGNYSAIVNRGTLSFYHSKITEYDAAGSALRMDNATFHMDDYSEISECSKSSGAVMNGECFVKGGKFIRNGYFGTFFGGGAIYSNGTLHVEGTIFKENCAGAGGAITSKELHVNQCMFDSNRMLYWAGAISIDRSPNDVEIYNSVFKNNGSNNGAASGGAMAIDARGKKVILGGNTFQENFTRGVGAIDINFGTMVIKAPGEYETSFGKIKTGENIFSQNSGSCIIESDRAANLIVESGTFSNNVSSAEGVIYNKKSTVLEDVHFFGNTSTGQNSNNETVPKAEAIYNEGELELYGGANIEDEIMLAENKYITVKEKLSYPIKVAVEETIGESFRTLATYDTDKGDEDAYTNVCENVWNLLSVPEDKRDKVVAKDNQIGLVNQIYSQILECKNSDGNAVSGVCFNLYKLTENNEKKYLGITGITDEEGKVEITRLTEGTYFATIRDLPSGYSLNTKENYQFQTMLQEGNISVNVGIFNNDPEAKIVVTSTEAEVGEEINFSGTNSTDDHTAPSSLTYKWDFGDGMTDTKQELSHKYALPGTYLVMLTVTDEQGATNTAVVEVHIKGEENTKKLTVHLKSSETGESLKRIEAYILDENEEPILKPKNQKGTISVDLLKNKKYYVYAQDLSKEYLPRQTSVQVDEEDKEITLYLSTNDTVQGKMTAEDMSYQDIVDAGIDLDCDENSHIVKYELQLSFKKIVNPINKKREVSIYTTEEKEGVVVQEKTQSDTESFEKIQVKKKGRLFYILIIDGTTKWLKDMFHVQLLIYNTSTNEFVQDAEATLHLPEGLSLATMKEDVENKKTQTIEKIEKNSQECVDWYVRGDENGTYEISASVKGKMTDGTGETDPFEFEHAFRCETPLEVQADGALGLTIQVNEMTKTGDSYPIRFIYTNVTTKPLCGLNFFIDKEEQFANDGTVFVQKGFIHDQKITVNEEGENQIKAVREGMLIHHVDELKPGESCVVTYCSNIQFMDTEDREIEASLSKKAFSILSGSTSSFAYTNFIVLCPVYGDAGENKFLNAEETYSVEVGDPIDLLTGAFTYQYTDVLLKGRHDLTFDRSYNSKKKKDSGLGVGWSTNFDWKIEKSEEVSEEEIYLVTDPSGAKATFHKKDDKFVDGEMSGRELTVLDGEYQLKDGTEKYVFNEQGQLSSIMESDGWTTTLTYSNNLLDTISSPAGSMNFHWESVNDTEDNQEIQELTEDNIQELDWSENQMELEKAENHIKSIEVNGNSISYSYQEYNLLSATNLDNDSMSFSYDKNGNILSVKDFEQTETVKNVYDKKGRVTEQTVTGEGTFKYSYDEETRTNTCTGENNYREVLQYDEEGRIVKSIGADEEEYTYNGFGKIVKTKDCDGYLHTAYDANGNIERIVYPDGTSEEYHYNDDNLLTYYKNRNDDEEKYAYTVNGLMYERVDANGNTLQYEYDTDGNLSKEISAEGNVTEYTYDHSGQVATKKDAEGNITRYTYDSFGRVTTEGISEEQKKIYEYSTAGKLEKVTDEKGREINYTVNKNGFTTETKDARQNKETTKYNAQSKVSTTTSKEGYQTSYEFDKRGNVSSEKDANGNKIKYTYDSYGNVSTKTDEMGNLWTYVYDNKSRLIKMINPFRQEESYVYDQNGKLKEKTNINGTTSYSYDDLGNLLSETDSLQYSKYYRYDQNGNLVSEVDANGNATLYKYDKDNRLITKETDTGKTEYVYDKNGNNIIIKNIEVSENGDDVLETVVSEEHFTYDYAGRVVTYVDANHSDKEEDVQITYTYDAVGNLTDETKRDGGTIHYEYDENDNVISKTNERGITESYTYDKQDRLLEVKDNDGNCKHSYQYDCDDNITFETNGEGYSTKYTYDKAGRLEKKSLGSGDEDNFTAKVTYTYEYDALGKVTKEEGKDEESEETMVLNSYTYDEYGNLVTVSSGSGENISTKHYTYNSRGEVTEETDGNSNTTSYSYDGNGNVSEKTQANGNVITYVYDSENRVIEQSESNGKTYHWVYDFRGNITKYTDAENHVTEYEYDKNGNNTKLIDASGNFMTMTYDGMDRLIHKESNGKFSEDYTYDQAGNIQTQTDSNGTVTTYEYNDDNKPVKVTKSKGTQSYTEAYSYDSLNRLTKVTYEDGTFESYTYDFQDKQTSHTDRNGNTTSYTYDGFGNLTKVIQPDGNYTEYENDERNLLKKKTDYDKNSGKSEVTTYRHDGNGNVSAEIRSANGKTITKEYSYDEMNHVSQVKDATSVLESYTYNQSDDLIQKTADGKTTLYSYNKNGELIKMETPDNVTSFTRDSLDRITTLETQNRIISYTYDADGNKESVDYGDGTTVHYTYDGNGNITEEQLGNKVTTFGYDYLNHRTSKHSRGVGEKYLYDENQNLTAIYATEGIWMYLLDQYRHDANGNITYHKETGKYSGTAKETTYSYDEQNRLKTESVTKDNQTTTTMYGYDGFGNLTSEVRGSRFINYTYNGLNQLTNKTDSMATGMAAFIGVSYNYDSQGNMTGIYDPGSVAGTTFTGSYNVEGQLNTAKKSVNRNGLRDIQSTYTYDGLGNPVSEQSKYTYNTKQTNLTTDYIYDYTEEVPTVLSEVRSDGVTVDYTYGDAKERMEAVITSTSVYNQTQKIYNISTDERGSSRWALDDVGNVMAKTSYDAWGSVTENNAVSLSPYIEDINLTESFTGYLYDEGTGLWNAGARTYDPETKHFLSEDPESGTMDDPISTVKYVYAYDNPVMNVDPDGRSVWGTITSWGSKAYDTAKSWAGTAVNAVKKTAGYVKDKVVQGIETVRREGRKMLDVAASYVQKVICMIPDGVKKVWNDVNKLYDKIPNSVKFTIGAVGVAAAVVTGAAPLGAAVGVLAGAMLGGAAMNAGIYAAGAFFGYHDFSWKEMGKTAIDGAADGALFAGVGMIAKSVVHGVKNSNTIKNFIADETGGEINLSKFGKKNHAVESADTPLYESMMEERGISSTLTAEEKEACRAADLKMEYEGSDIGKELGGSFRDVNATRGADEVAHHMPQNAYDKTIGISRNDGPALLMSKEDHALTRTFAGKGKGTMVSDAGLTARQRLYLDVIDIRNNFGTKYNKGMIKMIKYAKTLSEFQ